MSQISGMPGFTVVEPYVSGFSPSANREASAWAIIDRANPSTVNYRPDVLEAASDSSADYDGVAVGKKTVVVFSRPLTPGRYLFNLASQLSAAASPVLADWVFNSDPGIPGIDCAFGVQIRCRLVRAAYDVSALTWTSYMATPPTLDPVISAWGISRAALVTTPMILGSTFTSGYRGEFPLIEFETGATDCYGMVLEIRPYFLEYTHALYGPTSESASFAAGVPFGTLDGHIYAIKRRA